MTIRHLATYALASLLAVPASGQLIRHPPVRVVADLGTCSSTPGSTGPRFAIVTDGASSTDCAVGGGANIVPCWCDGGSWGVLAGGGGGGTSVALDLADDDVNESTALTEIAVTTGDTNSIFTEPAPDKLLINVGANWPTADVASDLACTACVIATEIDDGAATATFALFSGGAGAASFRAITEADISDLQAYSLTDDQIASEVPFTPAGTIIATNVQAAIEEAASEAMQDGDPPTAHAASHSLAGGDQVTVTNLASGCTDAQVLGGTLAGTGVECQTDADTIFTPNADPGVDHSSYVAGHGDGANCAAGLGAGGVDASGAAQDCTDYITLGEVPAEVNNLGVAVTWANVPDANVDGAAEEDEINHDNLVGFVAAEHVPTRQAATDCTAETGGVTNEQCHELDDDDLYVCETGPCNGAGWVLYTPAAAGDGVGYDTVADEGTPLTKRARLNMIGGIVSCADDGVTPETDCTFTDHFTPTAGISTDHGAGAITATTDFAGTLCGTNEILEDQGASWACIATPSGAFTSFDITDTDATPILTVNDGEQIQFIGSGTVTVTAAADVSNHDVTITGSAHFAPSTIDTDYSTETVNSAWVVTGDWDFSGGGIEIENGATPPACTEGQLFFDTDATSGQRLMACEAGTFVVQGDGGGAPGADSIGTIELDDGADTPSVGQLVAVDSASTALFEYLALSSEFSSDGDTLSIAPGADHIDAMSEIAAGIKRGPDATDTHLLTTDVAAPAGLRCLEMDTDGSVTLAADTCANLGPGGTPSQIVAGDSNVTVTDTGTGTVKTTVDGVVALDVVGAASGVNYLKLTPAAATASPIIETTGTDTNISLTFTAKGSGDLKFPTTTSGKGIESGEAWIGPWAGSPSSYGAIYNTGNESVTTNYALIFSVSDTFLNASSGPYIRDDNVNVAQFVTGQIEFFDLLKLDNQKELRFTEANAGGENYLALMAPAAVTANQTCTLEDDASFIPDSCVGDGTDATATECSTSSCNLNAATTLNSQSVCLQDGTNCPAAGSGDIEAVGDCTTGSCFVDGTNNGSQLVYEGATVDTNQTVLAFTGDPGGAFTVTIPNETGTACTTGSVCAGYEPSGAYSGIGSCGANSAATTLNDGAGPTCSEFTALGQEIALTTETSGNYVADVTAGSGIAVTHTPGEGSSAAVAFDYSDAGTDPALAAEECRFSNEGASDGGWICEGVTANTFETRFRVTDPTAERIVTFPNADTATAQAVTCSGTDKVSAFNATTGAFTCSADQSGGAPPADSVGTSELDDGADTPGSGDYVRVDTVDQAGFEYRTPAEVLADIGAQATLANYVATVADGTGIDGTASGAGSTYTPTLDLTEINSTTFGDNTVATVTHTVNPTGTTDPVWSYSDGTVNLSTGNIQEGGVDLGRVGSCTNQFVRAVNTASAPTCATVGKTDAAATFVHTDQANTYSTGAQSFASATSLTVPTAAGASPTTSALIAYDSTSNTLEYGENGTNRTVANLAGTQTLSSKTLSSPTISGTATFGSAAIAAFNAAAFLTLPQGGAPVVSGASGRIAVDTTADQLIYRGASTDRILSPQRTICATIENLAAADDNFEFWAAGQPVTITNVFCRCRGTCSGLALFTLEDRGGTAMTITGTNPTCATTGNSTLATVTAGNQLVAGEGIAFDVTSVSPETDVYTLCVTYTVDRQ